MYPQAQLYNCFPPLNKWDRSTQQCFRIMRDPETGNSRGFGFISYGSFEASDSAIKVMNGQCLCNRQITVSYAYKKDTKGERHGTLTEIWLPATLASGPPTLASVAQANGTIVAPMPPRPIANGVAPATKLEYGWR